MNQKNIISCAAVLTLALGIVGPIGDVAAKQRRDDFRSRADHYAYPDYYERKYGYADCRYRMVAVKKWNNAKTKLVKVYKRRWVC